MCDFVLVYFCIGWRKLLCACSYAKFLELLYFPVQFEETYLLLFKNEERIKNMFNIFNPFCICICNISFLMYKMSLKTFKVKDTDIPKTTNPCEFCRWLSIKIIPKQEIRQVSCHFLNYEIVLEINRSL